MKMTEKEIDEIYKNLEETKSRMNINGLANIANCDVETEKGLDSIMTEEEKNDLIASYGRSDIYLYGIKLNYLNAMTIIKDDDPNKFFNYKFFHRSITSLGGDLGMNLLSLGDSYTLIKYLGNNKFEEYYTGKIINLYRDSYDNPQSFAKKLADYKENPLCILVGFKDLQIASSDIEKMIIDNMGNRDKIIEFIDGAHAAAQKKLDGNIIDMVDNDHSYAKEEDKIRQFKKVIRR